MPRHWVLLLCLAACSTTAVAQLFGGVADQRGSGEVQTCDTSMHVDFTINYLNNYSCQLEPTVVPGNTTVTSATWNYYTDGTWWAEYGSPVIPYVDPTPYPICYTVEAYDLVASQPCISAVCRIATPVPYAICTQLTADFGIAAVDGNTITFENLSQFPGGDVLYAFWSFGDGSTIASTSATNTFGGPGPYEICLTVVGGPPTNCVATRCQWLYLGPGGLPCEELVSHGFETLTYNNLVGVLDTSRTSGMNTRIDWDFGDGAAGHGTIAVHAYGASQEFQLCGTLSVWGPLLSDTCVTTLCRPVWPTAPVGVESLGAQEGGWAWPSPFTDVLSLLLPETRGPVDLTVLDGMGRAVLRKTLPAFPRMRSLDTSALSPGCYTLMLTTPTTKRAMRVVKQP